MKILIKYILIILSISQSIKSQNFNNASASIEQAFFQLNKLAISTNLLKDSTNNGQLSIESLKFGFDDIAINNVDNEAINMIINGPNIFLDHFEFSTKYKLPNFYNLILTDLSDRRYETPVDAFEVLEKAAEAYLQKFNRYPKDYNDLIIESMISPNKYPFNNSEWNYNISLPLNITARTTSMHKRKGKIITLDWKTKTIVNKESDNFAIDSINWSLKFKINKTEQSLLSNTNVTLSPENFNMEFYQKYGRFSLKGMSITAVPNNDIFEQTIFNINDISLNINDLFFQIVNKKGYPNFQNGSGSFSIKNLELKIPPSIAADETINFLMLELGARNGLLRIRRSDISFRFYDNEFGIIKALFDSPFLKINISGQFSIDSRKKHLNSLDLFDTEIRINPISYGVRDIIRDWEIKNNKNLYREGPVVVIKLTGPINKLNIIGLD
jgi:hypothetical protein|tara:strand:+ start:3203 stop:4525 length:1323 start_codon:yes stop_codon:yes gene_type:complete